MNAAEPAKDTSFRDITRAQVSKIVLVPTGFLDLLGGEPAVGVGMDQNTGEHPSGKEMTSGLGLKPERRPPDRTYRVEHPSQAVPLRKASVGITPAQIGTQVHVENLVS
jgi:hypothetical protein